MGGEGIVLKEPGSIYQPGIRTTAWLKVKPKLTLDVVVGGLIRANFGGAIGGRRSPIPSSL
jgi:bifunctional non-homologous end joining protein LigD